LKRHTLRSQAERVKRFVLIVVFMVALAPAAFAASETFSRDAPKAIPKLMSRYAVPAADVAIVQGSTVAWSLAFGAHVSTDLFEVASLSKTATSLAVLRLVEEHKIALDAPVNDYLHRWKVTSTRFDVSKVTVRRLLDHTAGLPMAYVDEPLSGYPDIVDILNGKAGLPKATPVYAPGSRFLYSNVGYGVLELLIQEVTHKSYPDAMKALVFNPLLMLSSGYQDDIALETQVVPPTSRTGHPIGPFLRIPRAAGGLLSTEHDIGRLLVGASVPADLGGLLQPATLDQMHRVEPVARGAFGLGRDGGYALGIATGTFASGRRFFANSGNEHGANAIMIYIPSKSEGLVVLTDSTSGFGVEADATSLWLRDTAHESIPLLAKLTLSRNVVRLIAILGLLGVLYELDRLVRQWRRGQRRWSERFRPREIVKGIGLIVLGGAILGVIDGSALTAALGGITPARFISGEFQLVTVVLGIALIVAGIALGVTARTMET
jgi:CubicO group peptidase (beta-lactamase class C family)